MYAVKPVVLCQLKLLGKSRYKLNMPTFSSHGQLRNYMTLHYNLHCPLHLLFFFFDVLLTLHLSIILAINQLNAQNFFYNKFIICLYMFRALCAHHQEVKIVLCSIWYHHTCRWPSGAQVESTGRPPTDVMIPDVV